MRSALSVPSDLSLFPRRSLSHLLTARLPLSFLFKQPPGFPHLLSPQGGVTRRVASQRQPCVSVSAGGWWSLEARARSSTPPGAPDVTYPSLKTAQASSPVLPGLEKGSFSSSLSAPAAVKPSLPSSSSTGKSPSRRPEGSLAAASSSQPPTRTLDGFVRTCSPSFFPCFPRAGRCSHGQRVPPHPHRGGVTQWPAREDGHKQSRTATAP